MKAKRRQELKTNDLAQTLQDLGESFRQWGVYVVGAVALVVVVAVISSYRASAEVQSFQDSYSTRGKLSSMAPGGVELESAAILANLEEMGRLADQSGSLDFKLDTLSLQASLALMQAEKGEGGIDPEYLSVAEAALKKIIDNHSDSTVYYGRALCGMFQVEADKFVIDKDVSHREKAEKYLDILRTDNRFSGLPFQKLAIDLYENLDNTFTVVEFPKAPEPVVTKPEVSKPAITSPVAPVVTPSAEDKAEKTDAESAAGE